MQTLLTLLFTGLLVSIGATAAWVSVRAADDCRRHAGKLATMRGRVIALEGALEGLAAQHRKLAGKFHGTQGARRAEELDAELHVSTLEQRQTWPECENWHIAQIEGPRSNAALCECGYCAWRREQRARLKDELMPKSQAARIQSMKDGLNQ